jgi:superfamily I DNA and RNA helicase
MAIIARQQWNTIMNNLSMNQLIDYIEHEGINLNVKQALAVLKTFNGPHYTLSIRATIATLTGGVK